MGKFNPKDQKVKVRKINIFNTKIVNDYDSIYEAATINKLHTCEILRVCRENKKAGKLKYRVKDWYFVFIKD